MPDFTFEYQAFSEGFTPVVGVDEAGRGSWAGPVVACAVILDAKISSSELLTGLDDSKKISKKRRNKLNCLLTKHASIGVGVSSVEEIDKLNILQATFVAMKRSIQNLGISPGMILVDGNTLPDWPYNSKAIIKGDSRSLSIAAASIVAKVSRDCIMTNLANNYPEYGWERNAGYGTKLQQQALSDHGITKHHRLSFKPVLKFSDSRYRV